MAALLLAGCVPLRLSASDHAIDMSSAVSAAHGIVVFSDDFHDPGSGWRTDIQDSGTAFKYQDGYLVQAAAKDLDHVADSPYDKPLQQLTATVVATLSEGTPADGGFGVSCIRGEGPAQIAYQMIVTRQGRWLLQRRDGDSADDSPYMLKAGDLEEAPGSAPLTLEGICATLKDGRTTRLLFFVAGKRIADLVESQGELPDPGWTSELLVRGDATGPVTVTFTRFTERDASL